MLLLRTHYRLARIPATLSCHEPPLNKGKPTTVCIRTRKPAQPKRVLNPKSESPIAHSRAFHPRSPGSGFPHAASAKSATHWATTRASGLSWGSGDAYSCPDDSQQRGYEIPTSMFSETKASDAKKKNDGRLNIGALIIRIGCWGTFYHDYKKEPPKSYR